MNINPTDQVLHVSFDDEAFGRADVFCGMFNKRQVANKVFKPLEYTATSLPFEDKAFDVVYATNILAYSVNPIKMFDEIKRIGRRCHLKERSEFAEMIFGWDNTQWIIDVENKDLIVKSKNFLKCGKFGPLFHHLYATDPLFHDYMSQNPGLFSIAVDWYEEDDIVEYTEVEEQVPVEPELVEQSEEQTSEESTTETEQTETTDQTEVKTDEVLDLGEIKDLVEHKDPLEEPVLPEIQEIKTTTVVTKKIKNVQTVFRPCQTEYFDDFHTKLGVVSDKIDVRMLKGKISL